MANPQNIEKHKFKKGQTGNPNGRPRVLPELKEVIVKILSEEKTNEKGVTMSGLDAIVKALHAKAAKGDVRAAQELFDRYYGKVVTNIDVKSGDEPLKPTRIVFKKFND